MNWSEISFPEKFHYLSLKHRQPLQNEWNRRPGYWGGPGGKERWHKDFLSSWYSKVCFGFVLFFPKMEQRCSQKGQSGLLSRLLLKACATFIWADNELVIISTEGPDSFWLSARPIINSPCLIQSVFMQLKPNPSRFSRSLCRWQGCCWHRAGIAFRKDGEKALS